MMSAHGPSWEPSESLSLAGLVEQLTREFERTGQIDTARWATTYREWRTVILELSLLILELAQLGENAIEPEPRGHPPERV